VRGLAHSWEHPVDQGTHDAGHSRSDGPGDHRTAPPTYLARNRTPKESAVSATRDGTRTSHRGVTT